MPNNYLYFFEQADFSLRFARCVISETSLQVEEMKEFLAGDNTSLGKAVPAGTPVICGLRPKPRHLHLATAAEAKCHPGLAGLRQFTLLQPYDKLEQAWFTGVEASDGGAAAGTPWLLSLCSEAAQQQACATFEAVRLAPARRLDATIACAGALVSIATGPMVLLEIGQLSSTALLIGPKGVLAVQPVTLNLGEIATAAQTELNLKSRGEAASFFLDPAHDFRGARARIAARLGAMLKSEIARLTAGHAAPESLYCAGLTGNQQWLAHELAGAVGLAPCLPEIDAWCAAAGMTFATAALETRATPDWFGFLHFINSQTLESQTEVAWQAEWRSLKVPIARQAVKGSVDSPAVKPDPAPAKSEAAAAAAPVKAAPVAASEPSVSAPTPAVAITPSPAAADNAAGRSATPDARLASIPREEERPRRRKRPLVLGAIVFGCVLLGAGYAYSESQKEEAAHLAHERQVAAEQIRQAQQVARLAEQKAQEEANARKQFEMESAQKLAEAEGARQAAEAARRQAEAEASRQAAAARLANARGNLVVTTMPAGANVTVGNLLPRSSPATFSDLRIGKYPVTITLSHHENVALEVEVTEDATTETGTINLVSFTGALELVSEPAGVDYEIYPVNTPIVSMDAQRTGTTPAKVEGLDPGDYSVTFSRPGWGTHSETISVARNATARLAWAFPTGSVRINTSPAGATVISDGAKLGVTPLTLEHPLGSAHYELTLPGYDPVNVSGAVETGRALVLSAQLHQSDRTFGAEELDQPPEALSQKAPKLPDLLTVVDGRVVMQMTINRDGRPTDIKVLRASHPEIGKLYLAAAAKWKFKPGLIGGKPVRTTVILPILITAAKF